MGFFDSLFHKAPIAEFAASMAQEIAKRYPPALDRDPSKRPSVNRMTRILEDVCAKAVGFQVEHKLGWIGKARLGNAIKWDLQELGYGKEFVEFATEAVIVTISKGKQASAAAK